METKSNRPRRFVSRQLRHRVALAFVTLLSSCGLALGVVTVASAGQPTGVTFSSTSYVSANTAAIWTIGFTPSVGGVLSAGNTVQVAFPSTFTVTGATATFGSGFSGGCTTPTVTTSSAGPSENVVIIPLTGAGCTLAASTPASVTITGISSPTGATSRSAFYVTTYADSTFTSPIDGVGGSPANFPGMDMLATLTYDTHASNGALATGSAPTDPSSPYSTAGGGIEPAGSIGTPTPTSALSNSGSLTLAGYTFAGWCTTNANANPTLCSGTSYAPGDPLNLSANTILYSLWTANTGEHVSYDPNGATGGSIPSDSTSYSTGNTVTVAANTGTLVRTGYTFAGWNTQANGLGTTYAATGSVTFTIYGTTVLYAKWTPNTNNTVTYNGNGNTGGSPPISIGFYTTGTTFTVQANTFLLTRTGYTFAGWNTLADGSGTSYAASGSVTFTIAGSVTLYAQWTQSNPTYQISFDDNGGVGTMNPLYYQYYSGEVLQLPPSDVDRVGYYFAGWSESINGSYGNFADHAVIYPEGNIILYAQWIQANEMITFNSNDAANTTLTENANYGMATTLLSNTFNRAGYTFSGWSTAGSGMGATYSDAQSVTLTSPLSLYAQWTPITETITFNANVDSLASTTQSVPYGVATVLQLTTLKPSGFVFAGWNTEADGSGTSYKDGASITLTGNANLYAQWITVCTPGSYWSGTKCVAAPVGTFVAVAGGSPIPCVANTFNFQVGATSCTPCATQTTTFGLTGQSSCSILIPPTAVVAVAGNKKATVSFSTPAGQRMSADASFTITSFPDAHTCTTSLTSSCTVSGLTNGVRYNFSVTLSDYGTTITASSKSNIVTPRAPALAVFSDLGSVKVFDGASHKLLHTFDPFGVSYVGALSVAVGDLNGDGKMEIIVGAGQGAAPTVKVFTTSGTLINSFSAFDPGFSGGMSVAVGDLNGDGKMEIIVGAGPGGGPTVKIFSASGNQLSAYFAFNPYFSGGVTVAAGDVLGGGHADIIVGAGKGGSSVIEVFDGQTGALTKSFFAFTNTFFGGVSVAAGDPTASGAARIIAGSGDGGHGEVAVYTFNAETQQFDGTSFSTFSLPFTGSVAVAAGDLNGDGKGDIIVSPGPGAGTKPLVFDVQGNPLKSFTWKTNLDTSGIWVAL